MARKVKSVRRTVRKKKVAAKPIHAEGTTPIDGDEAFELSASKQGVITGKKGGGGRGTSLRRARRKRSSASGSADGDDEVEGVDEEQAIGALVAPIGSFEGSDNFGGAEGEEQAFEKFHKGLVEEDRERVVAFGKERGVSVYDPHDMPSAADVILAKGSLEVKRAHRQYIDGMALDELSTSMKINKSAEWINSIRSPERMAKAIISLEDRLELRPLEFYPCEILIEQMRKLPQRTRDYRFQSVFSHEPNFQKMKVGYAIEWPQQSDHRYKMFAYLGRRDEVSDDGELLKERVAGPPYAFTPAKTPGKYSFRVDEAGEFCFATLVTKTEDLGKIKKELRGGEVDIFWIKVTEMGKKEPSATD